jgi:hypothetical protein
MISLILRDILLIAAGIGLFRVWQMAQPSQRWLRLVVAVGFLARAILGQNLFWISYARLPVARSMQIGNGLWFFARDGLLYVPDAIQAAEGGIWAIVTLNRVAPSVAFEQTLAVTILLLGQVVSVGLLINLFCYLGTVAVIIRWGAKEQRGRMAAGIAITAISLSPAGVLWSLQPLKDTFFQFLVVAFVAACAAWQRAWIAPGRRPGLLLAAVTMLVALYAIAGIRWYFAFALLLGTFLFFPLVAFRAAERRGVAFAAGLVLVALLLWVWVAAARPYIPETILRVFNPRESIAATRALPASLVSQLESAQLAFDNVGGRTSIRPGGTVARGEGTVSNPSPGDATPPISRSLPAEVPRKQGALTAATPVRTSPPPRVPTPENEAAGLTRGKAVAPITPQGSHLRRLLTGGAAVFLPRALGERLGIFKISGGRGLFWFTEVDTLVFDLMFFFAFFALLSRVSTSFSNPLVVFVALVTLLVTVPLVYVVTNFGTLFRLRGMIFLGALLTPMAMATAAWGGTSAAGAGDAPAPAVEPV